jgi:thiamine pyrophosphate-dependent acetolactate synthase large subunit-like protein
MAVWLMAGAHAAQASASRHASHVADEFLQPVCQTLAGQTPAREHRPGCTSPTSAMRAGTSRSGCNRPTLGARLALYEDRRASVRAQ